MKTPAVARFWPKVHVGQESECWLWIGARKGLPRKQYGNFRIGEPGRQNIGAHVFSWELANGPVPLGIWVLHRCDVMLCVNPAHLFLGTSADNHRDMCSKDRNAYGSRHWNSKISEDDAYSILTRVAYGEPQGAIAGSLGLSQSSISMLVSGKHWRRVQQNFDPYLEIDSMHDHFRMQHVQY